MKKELTKEEKEKAKEWRIKKCGSTDFKDLKKKFKEYLKEKDGDTNKKT